MAFIISLNFAFAIDDNSTDLELDFPKDTDILEVNEIENTTQIDDDSDNESVVDAITITGKITKQYNGAIQYQANACYLNGTPVEDICLDFYVDGEYQDYEYTNSKGIASTKLDASLGKHTLTVRSWDYDYNYTTTFTLHNLIKADKLTTYYDSGAYYKVRIYGKDGKPVKKGEKVKFIINSKEYTKKTDKNGYAKLKINFVPDTYKIITQYKNFRVSKTLNVKKVLKTLSCFQKRLPSTFKYKVKYIGPKNKNNKKITVKFNKKTYYAKTDKKGIATFTLKTPKKNNGYSIVSYYKKSSICVTFVAHNMRGYQEFILYKGIPGMYGLIPA